MINVTANRRRRARLAALLIFVAAGIGVPNAGTASAATARGQCFYFDFDGVRFHNYDYLSEQSYCNNVDWATSLVFYNMADINKVKSQLDKLGYEDGSTDGMHMPVRTFNKSIVWDRDAGKKEIACPASGLTARHYRIYAPPAYDYMYTAEWGYFVVGSTHKDANECPPIGKKHYDSEEVEKHIAGKMAGAGYTVYKDYGNFKNYEPYRVEGNHIWNNNGYATYILFR